MAITTDTVVTQWLRSNKAPGSLDPDQILTAYKAAEAYVAKRIRPIVEGDPVPDDLVLAVCLQTARFLARRNSPEGTIATEDFGPVRVGGRDYDVSALIGPYQPAVV